MAASIGRRVLLSNADDSDSYFEAQVTLHIFEDDEHPERTFAVTPTASVPIGRSSSNPHSARGPSKHNAIIGSPVVSRVHCELKLGAYSGELRIRDQGSMHGTFLNDRVLERGQLTKIESGDIVALGRAGQEAQDKRYQCRSFHIKYTVRKIQPPAPVVDLTSPRPTFAQPARIENAFQKMPAEPPTVPTKSSTASRVYQVPDSSSESEGSEHESVHDQNPKPMHDFDDESPSSFAEKMHNLWVRQHRGQSPRRTSEAANNASSIPEDGPDMDRGPIDNSPHQFDAEHASIAASEDSAYLLPGTTIQERLERCRSPSQNVLPDEELDRQVSPVAISNADQDDVGLELVHPSRRRHLNRRIIRDEDEDEFENDHDQLYCEPERSDIDHNERERDEDVSELFDHEAYQDEEMYRGSMPTSPAWGEVSLPNSPRGQPRALSPYSLSTMNLPQPSCLRFTRGQDIHDLTEVFDFNHSDLGGRQEVVMQSPGCSQASVEAGKHRGQYEHGWDFPWFNHHDHPSYSTGPTHPLPKAVPNAKPPNLTKASLSHIVDPMPSTTNPLPSSLSAAQVQAEDDRPSTCTNDAERSQPSIYKSFGFNPVADQGGALADYQMQLMLLEQVDKKRKAVAAAGATGPNVLAAHESNDVSGDGPVRSVNDQVCKSQASDKGDLADYQMQLMLLDAQDKKNKGLKRANDTGSDVQAAHGSKEISRAAPAHHINDEARETEETNSFQDLFDNASAQGPRLSQGAVEPEKTALADYQMQMMLLEQQNKKRFAMAQAEHLGKESPHVVEQARKTAETSSWQDTSSDAVAQRLGPVPEATESEMRIEYQMQLMLLEQQNKKRLVMARAEQNTSILQDTSSNSFSQRSAPVLAATESDKRIDYQMRLILQEQQNEQEKQNKQRIAKAQAERSLKESHNTQQSTEVNASTAATSGSRLSATFVPDAPDAPTVAPTPTREASTDRDWAAFDEARTGIDAATAKAREEVKDALNIPSMIPVSSYLRVNPDRESEQLRVMHDSINEMLEIDSPGPGARPDEQVRSARDRKRPARTLRDILNKDNEKHNIAECEGTEKQSDRPRKRLRFSSPPVAASEEMLDQPFAQTTYGTASAASGASLTSTMVTPPITPPKEAAKQLATRNKPNVPTTTIDIPSASASPAQIATIAHRIAHHHFNARLAGKKTTASASTSSAVKPFLLGALAGGIGVLGALIGLPESYF